MKVLSFFNLKIEELRREEPQVRADEISRHSPIAASMTASTNTEKIAKGEGQKKIGVTNPISEREKNSKERRRRRTLLACFKSLKARRIPVKEIRALIEIRLKEKLRIRREKTKISLLGRL